MDKIYWDAVWSSKFQFRSENVTSELPWDIYTHDVYLERVLEMFHIYPCKVLELGCGSGFDAAFLSRLGFETTAIDISEKAIDKAKHIHYNSKVNFVVADIVNDNIGGKFDLIFDRGCIHNINKDNGSWESVFIKLGGMLHDNGKLVIITGNNNQPLSKTTVPTRTSLAEIELSSRHCFKILMVREIPFKLNPNYVDGLGWIFVMEKK